jgi:hypothetical protein
MQIFTLPDNSIVGPFVTLKATQGGYLADDAFLAEDLVTGGVISTVPDDYVTPEQQAALTAQFNAQQKKNRFAAYTVESDPIFFKSQRDEATKQEWLDAVASVDEKFPYKQ